MAMSGPLVRFAAAPAMAIVAWRVIFAWPVLAAAASFNARGGNERRRPWMLGHASIGGFFLAATWLTWVLAVQHTLISCASLLSATGALWAALLSRPLLGERVSLGQWCGLACALVGVSMVTLADLGGVHTLRGDLLALGSSLAWTGYAFVGRRARQKASFAFYTATLYLIAGLFVVLAAQIMRVPMWHFSRQTWLAVAALALFPTLIGHGAFNYLLRFIGPVRLGLWSLSEPVIATIIAWVLFGERPTSAVFIGGIVTLVGVGLGVRGEEKSPPSAAVAD